MPYMLLGRERIYIAYGKMIKNRRNAAKCSDQNFIILQ